MNTRFLKTACLLGILGAFSLAADAQSAVAKASVPFEFAAAGAMLPPGEYTVEAPDLYGRPCDPWNCGELDRAAHHVLRNGAALQYRQADL